MSNVTNGVYALLSPKARGILSILLRDYEGFGRRGLTRRQIARHLRQRRLYPHDDRALRTLHGLGLVELHTESRGAAYARALDDDQVRFERGDIALYVRYYVFCLDELAYEDARTLLGYASSPQPDAPLRSLLGRLRSQRRERL